jgi:hypothetical protein
VVGDDVGFLLMRGDLQGGLTDGEYQLATYYTRALELADLDGDGDLDVAYAEADADGEGSLLTGNVGVGRNEGGIFVPEHPYAISSLVSLAAVEIATGDFDRDGTVDVALAWQPPTEPLGELKVFTTAVMPGQYALSGDAVFP